MIKHWQNINIKVEPPRHPVTLFKNKLTFRNDLGNAAGLDKDGTLLEFNYKMGAGFAVVGTVLSSPHSGNLISTLKGTANPWTPLPYSQSALNTLGLPSIGIDKTLDNIKRFQDKFSPKDFPIGLSLMAHPKLPNEKKADDLMKLFKKSKDVVDFIEINESCPNVGHKDGLKDLEGLKEKMKAINSLQEASHYTPTLYKFSQIPNPSEILPEFDSLNVDGIVAVNTQKDYKIFEKKIAPEDKSLFNYYIFNYQGGLSGKAIRSFSFNEVKKASDVIKEKNLNLELIHIGGISTSEDIQESRKMANLREWYTGFMEAIGKYSFNEVYKKVLGKT